jgi:PAS domain S-box-containing protein
MFRRAVSHAWDRVLRPTLLAVGVTLGVAVTYFVAAQPGLAVALPSGNVSAVWPAAGVALIAVLCLGRWGLAGAWLGHVLVNLYVFGRQGQQVPSTAAFALAGAVATGAAAEALLNCVLLRRWADTRHRDPTEFLQRVSGVFTFVSAALAAAAIAAGIGTVSMCVGGKVAWSDFGFTWCTWVVGDAIGVLLVTPLLLPRRRGGPSEASADAPRAELATARRRRRAVAWEAAAVFVSLVALGFVVFELPGSGSLGRPALAFLYIPALVWTALRFGSRGAGAAVAVMSALALCATLTGSGPFVRAGTHQSGMHESLLLLQLFVGAGSLTALAMAAAVAEHRDAAGVVQRMNADLEQRIAARTSELESANRTLRHEISRKAEILQSYLRDMADRKRAESALLQSEQRFRIAAASATDLIYDWDVGGGDLQWFGEIDKYLGYSPGQFPRTLKAWEEVIHPDDRSRVTASLEHSLQTGATFCEEYRVLRKGGGVGYWIDRGASVQPDGGVAAAGHTLRFVGAVTDVTARRLAENTLRATDERLRRQNAALVEVTRRHAAVVEDLPAAVNAVTETAARTLEVERVSVWLFDPQKTKIRCIDLFQRTPARHTAGLELEAAHYPAYFKSLEQDNTIAANDVHADPRTREFSQAYLTPLGITSMLDAPIRVGGRTVGVLCNEHVGPQRQWTVDEQSFADSITNLVAVALEAHERRRAEQALTEHQKALLDQQHAAAERQQHAEQLERERLALKDAVAAMEQVLGVVGHELRTPLAALRAISEFLLSDDARATREWEVFLRNLNDEVVRMSDTVDALLEAARLNSGQAKWNWTEFDLGQACDGALEPARPLVNASRVALTCRVEPPDARMRGDADAVRRLVTNLVTNARKHTTDGGIEVAAQLLDEEVEGVRRRWVQLHVSDTGSGIPPEIVERLGEAFALNAGVVGARHVSGTGLGIAICKGIVEAHGGEMTIDSAPGRGTTVLVRLWADLDGPVKGPGKGELLGGLALAGEEEDAAGNPGDGAAVEAAGVQTAAPVVPAVVPATGVIATGVIATGEAA